MKFEKFQRYQDARTDVADSQNAWPLFGAGLQNLGKNGRPVETQVPSYADDEILMRIDAVSLCYTDVKQIDQGPNHPRLKGRDLLNNPIVPGHEVSMTVVGVGANLKDQYHTGQRFTIQPDVWVDGKSIPFCFGMDGAYRQYAVIDQRILAGDAGNYLIPLPGDMTYAAGAITEPWACVEAAYRMSYRSSLLEGGEVLLVGQPSSRRDYQLDADWVAKSKPAAMYVCNIPDDLQASVRALCLSLSIEFGELTREEIEAQNTQFDDILLLDGGAEDVTFLEAHMDKGGIFAFYNDTPLAEPIAIDVGRLHYDDTLYVGSAGLNLSDAYRATPVRSEFRKEGIAWILGAGGPMGRMHLQRAIESPLGPRTIIASEVSEARLKAVGAFFGPLAQKNHKELLLTNPMKDEAGFARLMDEIMNRGGVDDIEVMITMPGVIEEALPYLAPDGVVNMFAGMKRGVKMTIDPWSIIGEKQIRFIGHSGSGLDDQKAVVERCISRDLDTDLSVAAIGGLNQISEGVQSMKDSIFPGKIVIFPQIQDFPLTGLAALENVAPEVAAKLGENQTWNSEAEQVFLEGQLP